MQMDAILSIKPIYANQILAGTKKVEFRKRKFKEEVRKVYIYASVPVKQIVGYFTFSTIDEDTPVFWPGEFQGLYSPRDHKESETTEQLLLY